MARQYGEPANIPGKPNSDRKDQQPEVKKPDPSPSQDVVKLFHRNAQVDTRPEDIHHTLGITGNHASRGDHRHRGGDSELLLGGVTITGSRGGNAALFSVISALVQLGAKDSTTV